MLENTVFSLTEASPSQLIAFVVYAISTIAFFVWVIISCGRSGRGERHPWSKWRARSGRQSAMAYYW